VSVGTTFANYLRSTIVSGGGTSVLVLADAAGSSASARRVVHDDGIALQAFLDGASGRARLPAGDYVSHQTLVMHTQAIVSGEGDGITRILGCGMGPVLWAPTSAAFKSRLEDMTVGVFGIGHSLPVAHGLLANTRVDATHASISGHGGDGLHVDANAPVGNADGALYTDVRFNSNRDNGAFVTGGDANTIVFDSCEAAGNGRSGFLESGFLGNKYRVCHTQANGVDGRGAANGPYYVDHYESLNSTSFEQCYSEGGQPPIRVPAPANWIGAQAPSTGFTVDSARTPSPLAAVSVVLDFGAIPAGSEVERSVTYSGASASSWLRVRLPSVVPAGVSVTAWVASPNVIRVRARNSGATSTALSGTFGLLVEVP
jgi:hypothetical protein